MEPIATGLYRTTLPMPGNEEAIPAGVLVYVGRKQDGALFVVRPGANRKNRWFWGEPTLPLTATSWSWSLRSLPPEGFYNLPETLEFGQTGRWVRNAIVQLGYNEQGQGIAFVAEDRRGEELNALFFSAQGRIIDDKLLDRLVWAPILPVEAPDPNVN